MPSPRRPLACLLLVCLFASSQQVSPKSFLLCGMSVCSGERCCAGQCCSEGLQEMSKMFGLVFGFMGTMIAAMCVFAACKCTQGCAALRAREPVDPPQPQLPPAPRPAPPGAPSPQPPEDPPPYSEVAWKPFPYPPPGLPPPCYSNVVMADAPETGVNHQTML